MGAYDNPTIIKDMYGAEAWAAAANQISNASVGMVKSFADAAIKRADKAEKEKKDRDALEASVTIKQAEAANKNFNSEEWQNAPKSLMDQAKDYNNFNMLGGVHNINGVDVDFGIGSVKAEMLVNDPNTSSEDRVDFCNLPLSCRRFYWCGIGIFQYFVYSFAAGGSGSNLITFYVS